MRGIQRWPEFRLADKISHGSRLKGGVRCSMIQNLIKIPVFWINAVIAVFGFVALSHVPGQIATKKALET